MRVCLLTPVLDAFKGANHLPLLEACGDVRFTILSNRVKPTDAALPGNVTVETIGARLGSFYYGCSDFLFARAVLGRYPVDHLFWKKFDVIHINQTMGPALLNLRKTGVPIVFFVHHPVSVDRAIALKESSFLGGLHWRLKYFFLVRWQRTFCRVLPHVATVSETAADRIAADYGCERSKIHVIQNGVDGDVFVPRDPAHAEHDVIAVGSFIHPRKGFRYLADAYRMLAAKGFRIADVGRRSGDQQRILASIPGVTTFGTVSHETLLTLLQNSKTLLSTSLYEGFGLSLIEALACGRPCVAFAAGATEEVLRPVDPSLLVPLRDTEALVRRAEEFLRRSDQERDVSGRVFRKKVLDLYPLQGSADALKKLYDTLSV